MTDMTLRREIPVRVRARDADYPDTRHMRHRGMARFHNHDAFFSRRANRCGSGAQITPAVWCVERLSTLVLRLLKALT
jgi:hypothetical protein